MRIFKCAEVSDFNDEFLDSIANSSVQCVGLRKSVAVKAKVVHYTEAGYSEPKRCKRAVYISKKRKRINNKKKQFIEILERERREVELEDSLNFLNNKTADLTV